MITSTQPERASVRGVDDGISHGTMRGYRQHRYREIPVCEPCRAANREDAAKYRQPRGDRRAQAWNRGMVGEPTSPIRISPVPAACTEPDCGSAGAAPHGWIVAVVDGAERRYCRTWCATYAQALADVRAIGRTVAA